MSETLLAIRSLQVQFPHPEQKTLMAVDDIDLEVKEGEVLGIVGESGSGKSVTALAIMGLISYPGKISHGEIWFNHSDGNPPVNLVSLQEKEKRKYRGGQIAMIFQEPMSSLNPVYTIGFQLQEAILLHQKISSVGAKQEAISRLQEVRLIPSDEQLQQEYQNKFPQANSKEIHQYIHQHKESFLQRYPHQLSGGQLQRVMIAMAISCNPSILIADEPTTALDVTVQATILELLRQLCHTRKMAMIFISHDLGVIREIANHVAVMYRGKIVENNSLQQILDNPQHPYTKGLLACRPRLDIQVQYLPTVADFMEVEGDTITARQGSYEVQEISVSLQQARLTQLSANPPLISVRNLSVGYPQRGIFGTPGYVKAVNDVSFDVYPGETLGLVGESGCGKSTLARTLLRLLPVLKGEIIFRGENIAALAMNDRKLRYLRREMQIVFQNPYSSLNPRMTIGRAIMEPMIIHQLGGDKAKRLERVAYLLQRVGLKPEWMNRYPHEFSGGQRQRVCVARALAVNPQFIICDESVSALDVSVQAQVLNLLKELQEEFGLTYIFISHDLSVVKFMSSRIMVMNKGIIEEIAPAYQIYNSPQKDYTRQLIASIPGVDSVR